MFLLRTRRTVSFQTVQPITDAKTIRLIEWKYLDVLGVK